MAVWICERKDTYKDQWVVVARIDAPTKRDAEQRAFNGITGPRTKCRKEKRDVKACLL